MTTPRHPTAPATRRTRPDGWLLAVTNDYRKADSERRVWHWLPKLGLGVAACGLHPEGHQLQDGPPDHGTLCKMCEIHFGQFEEGRFETPA